MTNLNNDSYQMSEVLSAFQKAGSALLFSHVSPDGDTIGSALALAICLRKLGWKVQLAVDGILPINLRFLPGINDILTPQDTTESYDTAIAVDVSCYERIGKLADWYEKAPRKIVIDHHATNEGLGEIQLIDGTAPATAVVVYRIIQALGQPITKEEAICLYAALSTDTGNFIYSNTTAESLRMMADLLDAGLPIETCSRILFREKELPFLRLLAEALSTLHILDNGRVAGMCVSRKMISDAGANIAHTDRVVDYAGDIIGVDFAYLIKEISERQVKVSLRAKDGFSILETATALGGGGHQNAAGATINKPLQEALPLVEQLLVETSRSQHE